MTISSLIAHNPHRTSSNYLKRAIKCGPVMHFIGNKLLISKSVMIFSVIPRNLYQYSLLIVLYSLFMDRSLTEQCLLNQDTYLLEASKYQMLFSFLNLSNSRKYSSIQKLSQFYKSEILVL